MTTLHDKAWIWGYVIPKSGVVIRGMKMKAGEVPFVGPSSCSLETAAEYLDIPNVVFMNSNHDKDTLRLEYLDCLAPCQRVICGLQHGKYAETAKTVSRISKKYTNIVGGLIDDFLDFHGPSKLITPKETRIIYEALKSENPKLKMYAVRYTWQDQEELKPYLPFIDVINLWVWVADERTWRVEMDLEIEKVAKITNKPIMLGLFLHDYGGTKGPVSMDVLQLQFQKAVQYTREGKVAGFVVLQSGWFDQEDHRLQVNWTKEYLKWVFGTQTRRKQK